MRKAILLYQYALTNIVLRIALDVKRDFKLKLNKGYDNMTFSLRLKQRRSQLEITQAGLALLARISQTQISKYESGEHEPTAYAISQLAKALNTSTDWLLGLTDEVNELRGDEDLSERERQLIQLYRIKSPDVQQKLLDIAKML